MARTVKELSEIAQKYRARLAALRVFGRRRLAERLEQLVYSAERMKNYRRLLEISLARKWVKAADRLGRDIVDRFPSWRFDCEDFEKEFNRLSDTPLPRASELAAELRQAEEEFGAIVYDRKQEYVAAITEPIVLEGIDLGAFEIRLLLADRGDCRWQELYQVVAQDPHPAEGDPLVTHPHVRNEILCAGRAEEGIQKALLSGRLCDFFLLVRSVLREYNSGSPHVALDRWDSSSRCFDCGSRIGGDSNYCATCENEFCNDCIYYCRSCYADICQNCRNECKGCEDFLCNSCIDVCPRCKNPLCKACMKNKRCSCQQKPEPQPETQKEIEEHEDQPKSPKKIRARTGRSRRRLPPLTVG